MKPKMSFFLVFVMGIALFSCQPESTFKFEDILVSTEINEDDEVFVGFDLELNLGNTTLPFLEIPIEVPLDGFGSETDNIGFLSISGRELGNPSSRISFNLNVTKVSDVSARRERLPNGSPLPVFGDSRVIELEIEAPGLESELVLYLALADDTFGVGMAIPIKEMDELGSEAGRSNLFPSFEIEGYRGALGFYTGKRAGDSGIGFFFDASAPLRDTGYFDIAPVPGDDFFLVPFFGFAQQEQADRPVFNYDGIYPKSKKKKKKLDAFMYKMHMKRQKFTIE